MYIGIWDFAGNVFYLYRGFIFYLVGKKLLIHVACIAFILSRSLLTLVKSSGLQTDPRDSGPLCKLMPAIEGIHRKNKLQSIKTAYSFSGDLMYPTPGWIKACYQSFLKPQMEQSEIASLSASDVSPTSEPGLKKTSMIKGRKYIRPRKAVLY